MQYISTRNSALRKSFSEVLLGGLASDGGLYMPRKTQFFSMGQINDFKNLSYGGLTAQILQQFVSDEINEADFKKIVDDSYKIFDKKDVVDLVKLDEQRWILELFHGPTLAFKDVAMQLLGNLLDYFSQKQKIRLAVLGATSGDTGSSAIAACSRYENIEVFILYPHGRVTEVQRRQMTTSNCKNVHALSVQTDFDGCQAIVKQLFLEEKILSNVTRFVSANSINWARCMTQSVHYFWTYLRLQEQLNELTFSVPSGNFGHAYAGWLAKEMGLPIKKIIVSTNSNEVLHKLFSKNFYGKGEVNQTLAPSMDISVASNFERLLFSLYKNNSKLLEKTMSTFPQKGISVPVESWLEIQNFFSSFSSSDNEILEEIENTYKKYNYILDPHTATGVRAAMKLTKPNQSVITMGTAHPAKFMEAIKQVINEEAVPVPNKLSILKEREEDFVILPDNIERVREYILSIVG